MERFNRHIRARDTALEEAPKVLKAIGVYAAIYVLSRVVNDLMRVVRCQSIVGHERIAVECRASSYMLAYLVLQYSFATARNHAGTNLSATLQDSHDGGLILGSRSCDATLAFAYVHIPSFAADESLVHFDFAAEFGAKEFILHCKANPLQHEPCRLLRNAHVTRNLVTADTVFAVRKHPRCREPLVQRDRRILVDRSDLDGELALGVMAATLPSTALCIEANLGGSATGTNYTVRPATDSNVVDAVVRIREVDDRFLKALGFMFHD